MKIRTTLLIWTAAAALSASVAYAAIDAQALADSYLAEGYDFVEVKQGPTQTKVEAIRDTTKVEVVYDNETGAILSQEEEAADAEDIGRTGSQVRSVDRDFEDGDDEVDGGHHGSGHDGDDDDEDDDGDDDDDDDDDGDRGGHDDDGDDDGGDDDGDDD
jgi:hypothetical protein